MLVDGLAKLHDYNRMGNLTRQIRQLLYTQEEILARVQEAPASPELAAVFHASSKKSIEILDSLIRGVTPGSDEHQRVLNIKPALESLVKLEPELWLAGDRGAKLVVARQYLLEAQEGLGSAYILQQRSADELFSRIHAQRFLPVLVSFVMAVVFLIFAGWLGYISARRIGNSIESLLRGTAIVAAGNLKYEVPVLQKDEMGELAQAFNTMTKRLEASTVSRERLEISNLALANANRELESFSYSVSHDLRAPLRAIDGFSQALIEDYGDLLTGMGKDFLSRIRLATQRMGTTIDDMLSLSRLSRVELVPKSIDLTALAKTIFREMHEAEPNRTVRFICAEGLKVKADAGQMKILLTNLLGNSWKYTSKKDSAEIEFGKTVFKGREMFFVRDNGAGFDMAYADKLFGAFQRLHSEADFPGTGVGLATVQRIVRRHGGWVDAEGRPGAGATFYFGLPDAATDSANESGRRYPKDLGV